MEVSQTTEDDLDGTIYAGAQLRPNLGLKGFHITKNDVIIYLEFKDF